MNISKSMLASATAMALVLSYATDLSANPKNKFGDHQNAIAVSSAAAFAHKGNASAVSESFNTDVEVISYQSMSAHVSGAPIYIGGGVGVGIGVGGNAQAVPVAVAAGGAAGGDGGDGGYAGANPDAAGFGGGRGGCNGFGNCDGPGKDGNGKGDGTGTNGDATANAGSGADGGGAQGVGFAFNAGATAQGGNGTGTGTGHGGVLRTGDLTLMQGSMSFGGIYNQNLSSGLYNATLGGVSVAAQSDVTIQ